VTRASGRRFDPFATALSAIENASSVPVSREDLPALLRTGEGEPSHLRALFSDVDLHTLRRMANMLDIDGETLARAYRAARRRAAAANPELENFAAQFDL
jgi:hypothetical protein